MTKPHGRDCPDRCSQCIGARAKQVDIAAGVITLDGAAKRTNVAPAPPQARVPAERRRRASQRGGRVRAQQLREAKR